MRWVCSSVQFCSSLTPQTSRPIAALASSNEGAEESRGREAVDCAPRLRRGRSGRVLRAMGAQGPKKPGASRHWGLAPLLGSALPFIVAILFYQLRLSFSTSFIVSVRPPPTPSLAPPPLTPSPSSLRLSRPLAWRS